MDALGVERTLSHPPVYNVSFLLQSDGTAPPAALAPGSEEGAPALPDGPLPADAEYELAVELPEDVDITLQGGSPLARNEAWVNTKCAKCGGQARREQPRQLQGQSAELTSCFLPVVYRHRTMAFR